MNKSGWGIVYIIFTHYNKALTLTLSSGILVFTASHVFMFLINCNLNFHRYLLIYLNAELQHVYLVFDYVAVYFVINVYYVIDFQELKIILKLI